MGKNYSSNQKKELRNERDFYQTPYSLTQLLVDNYFLKNNGSVTPNDVFYDPAAGRGAILKVLMKNNYTKCVGSDIYTLNPAYRSDVDFLSDSKEIYKDDIDWIITNPPFKLFNQFIIKSLQIAKKGIMIFGKLDFLTGFERYDKFYSDLPPTHVFVFNRKTMLEKELRGDGKFSTGIDGMCWFLWEYRCWGVTSRLHSTELIWLNNNPFVYRKRDNK